MDDAYVSTVYHTSTASGARRPEVNPAMIFLSSFKRNISACFVNDPKTRFLRIQYHSIKVLIIYQEVWHITDHMHTNKCFSTLFYWSTYTTLAPHLPPRTEMPSWPAHRDWRSWCEDLPPPPSPTVYHYRYHRYRYNYGMQKQQTYMHIQRTYMQYNICMHYIWSERV